MGTSNNAEHENAIQIVLSHVVLSNNLTYAGAIGAGNITRAAATRGRRRSQNVAALR